ILAALALFNLGHRLLASCEPQDADRRQRAHRLVARALGVAGMIGGQQLDLALATGAVTPTPVRNRERLKKTAALFSAAVVAGGSVGSATEFQLGALPGSRTPP